MSELHERVVRASLLQGAHVGRLEIIDLDELEQIEALHESGGASLARLLADKQTASLYRTALNQYLYFERRVPLTPTRPPGSPGSTGHAGHRGQVRAPDPKPRSARRGSRGVRLMVCTQLR